MRHSRCSDVLKPFMKQECILVGCVQPACCPYLPACTAPGGYLPGGVPARRRGGVPARRGVCLPRYSPPPWTDLLTHATENITLPKTSFAGGNHVCYK